METRNITNPAADMEGKITAYFGNAKCNVAVALVGRIADAPITYFDVKPVRVVRKELEEKFPDITISEIHREYSPEARMIIMQELVNEDPEIFLPYEDGSLRPLCLGELLQEKLFHRTLK
ncbi:MAG: hypothetical protein IJT13_02780 [Bacteroidaceae bacterium]|nr:hypothetical protein [Bacteroidaceae bacterium]